jgi:hypothetical protein
VQLWRDRNYELPATTDYFFFRIRGTGTGSAGPLAYVVQDNVQGTPSIVVSVCWVNVMRNHCFG